ncbi:MAG: DUF11 domain-containing protein [Promethearchaeota archaeon]|nr:MAG: DUF11 domain-containing protein [Candidatus Lokiarchaeota archaeon]
MKVFVLSFGTIEILDNILVIDSDLNYKTFEQEYNEILSHADKNVKKLLKDAFEKSEIAIKDIKTEARLIDLLSKLEAYDKPSFQFTPSFVSTKAPLTTGTSKKLDAVDEELSTAVEPRLDVPIVPEDEIESVEPEVVKISAPPHLSIPADTVNESALEKPPSSLNIEGVSEEPEVFDIPQVPPPPSKRELPPEKVTSNFLVTLEETAHFKVNHDLTTQDADASGKVTLQNAGLNDRLWDINVILKKETMKTTTLTENLYHINELSPGALWAQEYAVKPAPTIPITFRENIDTCPEIPEELHSLIPNKDTLVEFTLTVENRNKYEIYDLILKKILPPQFTNLKVSDAIPPETNLQFEKQTLTWIIQTLPPETALQLKFQVDTNPTDSVPTGPIQIMYKMVDALYSGLILEDISSISKNMYYIEKDENEQTPNHWNCRFIFENKSEFPFLLESAEIFSDDMSSDQKEIVFQPINELIPSSTGEWRSKDWDLTSEKIPTFGKSVTFKIIPLITKRTNVSIEIEEIKLPILWAEVKKNYSVSEIASYIDSPITIDIAIINRGDAEINDIQITDYLPENFSPPTLQNVKMLYNGTEVNTSHQHLQFSLRREPDSDNPIEPHKLIFDITDLKNSIGTMTIGSILTLQYSIQAIQPPPNKIYNFPTTLRLNTFPKGLPLEITPSMVDNAEIKVAHKRRKLTVGKSVFPGNAPDEYEVLILFKNRGTARIEHAVISDLVPENFHLVSSNPKASVKDLEGKTLLEWNFPIITPGERLELTYTLKGTGEYQASDAEIFYKG